MVSKLDILRATRSRILSSLQHRISVILAFADGVSTRKVKLNAQLLENNWAEFKAANDELDGLIIDETQLNEFVQTGLQAEDNYIEAKTFVEELLEEEDDNKSQHSSRSHVSAHERQDSYDTNIQLSRLTIKPFSGRYEDWSEFKDIFKSCVIKNKRMPNVQKLHQLKSLLAEEPSKLIKNLKMRENNFDIAWQTLNDHYENQNKVVWGYIQRFFEIPAISTGTASATDLQNIIIITTDMITSLTDFEIDTSSWDTLIIYVLIQKLDTMTVNYWHEERKAKKTIPTFKQFRTFLETRQNVSESKESRRRSMPITSTPKGPFQKPVMKLPTKTLLNQAPVIKCELCERDHRTYQCSRLINATYEKRLELVHGKNLCENCLYPHETEKCTSRYTCRACNDKHHTLLHPLQKTLYTTIGMVDETNEINDSDSDPGEGTSSTTHAAETQDEETVQINLCKNSITQSSLLATALIPVFTTSGSTILLRTLFDQGSETSLLTANAHQLINTQRMVENIPVIAVGNTPAGIIKYSTHITIGSLYDNTYRHSFKTLITKTIASISPKINRCQTNWEHIHDLALADPKYFEYGQIDLLLGVKEIAELLLPGLIKGTTTTPVAQQTKVGWVLSGTCGTHTSHAKYRINHLSLDEQNLSEILKTFWTIEEITTRPAWSPEEQAAENHFVKHTKRYHDGKMLVRLPFKSDPNEENFLGHSYDAAKARFFQVEKRLMRNEDHYNEYRKCINEYIELGHMRLVSHTEKGDTHAYFLPHHAVIKETSETTKLRVVFDASCKTSNGKSLNDQLYVGPTIQNDLFTLLVQWRKYQIAFTADIEKMYRQIWVDEADAKFQRILWRNSNTEPLRDYILKTVTFGTASAPFQAIRCLFKVAEDIESAEPMIAKLIRENFYVDDLLGSAETNIEATNIREKVQSIMEGYGLNLRKWKSNSGEFLDTINPAIQSTSVEHTFDSPCKALGLFWHPRDDCFYFKLALDNTKLVFTKRRIVSETARIFDPLGWLAPCIVKAKILTQQLWLLPLGWDDRIPANIETDWLKLRGQLTDCDKIKIPRWIGYSSKCKNASIHGFADASEEAYAAVVYLYTEHNGTIHVSLITAKTKVAPLKKLTIPQLELAAAQLLAKLITKVQKALGIDNVPIQAWTDSMVVLGWLAAPPHKWQTFVANRVSQIQEVIPPESWRHVPTKMNPADCASRGLLLNELRTHDLWWNGPSFLRSGVDNWPNRVKTNPNCTLPDIKKSKKVHQTSTEPGFHDILSRFSSWKTLSHTTAYCLRWINYKRTSPFPTTTLTVNEVQLAQLKWLKLIQSIHFAREIACLQAKNPHQIPRNSTIISLNPILDDTGLLRVGSRLKECEWERDRKEPIILPRHGHLTGLIIWDAHIKTFHGGNQLTMQRLRQHYWVIQGRNTIRAHLNKCTICFRHRNQTAQQLMGNLPKFRINEYRPFTYTGVDFAGYFDIKTSNRRNAPYTKAYIAVFICLTTRAMHLEVVSSLSTEAFLLAFKRFISRKLLPRHMYSDRGTNFIGAKNELPRLFQDARSEQSKELREALIKDQIEWHMIPAHAPHFGGLWEAGVRSTKHHLKRVLGDSKLNFEEFTTVIAQIEACLNSRPLYPQTEDPQDDEVLTPNHLLFAHEAASFPEPCIETIPTHPVNRYQLLQRLHTNFWQKWSQEYLTRLMHRSKWTKQEENLRPNQLVLIKEDNLPPTKWLYGRIIRVHPGKDGLVRVVEVKCKNSVLSRPIHKLCLLPIVDNQTEPETLRTD